MNELLLGPIVGGLSDSGANLWGRAFGPGTLHAWLGSRPDLSDALMAAKSLPLSGETGFAGVAPVRGLSPDTCYHYTLSLSPTPPDSRRIPYPRRSYPSFKTFPPRHTTASFAFAFGSCFRPDDGKGGRIFHELERRRRVDDLRFILLIGDQIYADAYDRNGIGKIAVSLQEYRDVYQYTWSRSALRRLLLNLPAFMILDDHEVDDDWTWTDHDRRQAQIPIWDRAIRLWQKRPLPERRLPRQRVQDALQAYWEHQGMHAPRLELPPKLDQQGQYTLSPADPGSLAYTFTYGSAAFFVLDSRTMRIKSLKERTMLGEAQWQALESWLLAVKDIYPVKFLVSSDTLLFTIWIDLARDRWSGFRRERNRLLSFLADHGIEGVHILTGDMHSAHAVRADLYGPQDRRIRLWEFCSSPFEQDPNTLTNRTYRPIFTGPLQDQQLEFIVMQRNFGVVKVDYSLAGVPRVTFQVYSEKGELIKETGATAPT